MSFTERLALLIDIKTAGATTQLKSLNSEVRNLEKGSNQASRSTGSLASQLGVTKGTAIAAGVALAGAFAVKTVQAASALNETMSKTKIVFGEASQSVIDFGHSADSIGLSDQAALDAVSSFGALFLGIGKTKDEAAGLGINLTKLAADMASFSNTSLETAITAIGAGLRGENEPLRQFNVLLDDFTLKQEAMKLGLITTTTAALTPAIKAQAAYSAILGQTSLQQGDFARTSDGLANKTKVLQARFHDLEAEIGENLVPAAIVLVDALTRVVDVVGDMGRSVGSAFRTTKEAFKDFDRTIGLQVDNVSLDAVAFNRVAVQVRAFDQAQAAAKQRAVELTRGLGIAAAQAHAIEGTFDHLGDTIFGAMNHAVAGVAQLLDYQQRLANFRAASEPQTIFSGLTDFVGGLQTNLSRAVEIGSRDGASAGIGSSQVEEAVDDFGDYLQAVAEDRLSKLDNVFAGLSSKLNFDDAASSLQEAIDKLAALKAESANLKGDIAGQQSLVGSLLAQSLTITPTEQVAIEQAEKNLADTLARFKGTITQATAPSSSFLGPTTVDVFNAPTASMAELQVAEERLAEAKATAVGPTRELEDAEKKLADLRDRQKDLPKLIADANRDLSRAQLALVDAQRQLNDSGQALIDQGPEFVTWFQTIATQAGLTGVALAGFTANLTAAMRAGGGAKGLVDVFGNGTRFATPSDANDILSYISGQFGGPRINKFAGGGRVPGYPGQPQMILAHGGEHVSRAGEGGGGAITINVNAGMGADGQAIARYVHQELLALQRRSGRLGLN